MMIPIFVMKSVAGGHFVPFFVKYIKLKCPSRLQRLTGKCPVPLEAGLAGVGSSSPRSYSMKKQIKLKVNGVEYDVSIKPHWTLLDVLRNEIGLTGTKKGCGRGECGACTVIMNGKAILSCLVLAIQCRGKDILTIEGLAQNGELGPLQDAFVKYGAIQCGFCTPGMIMASRALLNKTPHPSEEEIKRGLSGNLCRCTGYTKIIAAVQKASTTEGHQ
jgi:carbon-monoxide dehydrogenase small subunit